LTVQQTLKFALSTKTPATRIPGLSRDAFVQQMLELFAKMFGMMHTLNTMVGNQFIRGVSGGERKRVSIIEVSIFIHRIITNPHSTQLTSRAKK